MPSSLVVPSATFLPSRQSTGSQLYRRFPTGTKGFPTEEGQRKSQKVEHPASSRHKVWKVNKKLKKMVVGSDAGLEETCRMAL
jgi:hypothetical protein